MKLAQGSTSWILFPLILGLILLILSFLMSKFLSNIIFFISLLVFLIAGFFLLFFRDPERTIGNGIVACADGKIREITNEKDDQIGDFIKISTFMNVYNVHVNRMPLNGSVKDIKHYSGIHLPAYKKESEKNERVITTIDTNIGSIKIVQIAGTLARRIKPYIKSGDKLKKGERIGIIRLGSRVDLYLPAQKIKNVKVEIGDIILAGETTLAEVND